MRREEGKVTRRRNILFFLLIIIGLPLGFFFSLPYLLIAPPENQTADAIFHLVYDPHLKANEYVLALYKKRLARKILCVSSPVAWNVYPSDYVARQLIAKGVKKEDISSIHQPESNSDCGAQDLSFLIHYAQKQGWKKVLLVVHPIGSRILRHLVRKYFGREGIQAFVTYSPEDYQNVVHHWWNTHWKAQGFVSCAVNAFLDQLYPHCR